MEHRGTPKANARIELIAIIDGKATVHRLPARGSVVLGRGGSVDVPLEHASVSRRHASLHLDDGVVVVEDLGSANGTRLLTTQLDARSTAQTVDRRLDAHTRSPVPNTAAIHLGSVVVLVRPLPAEDVAESAPPDGMIVESPAMKKLVALIERIAVSPLSVLLVGETGAGKDVVARALHARSPRRGGPFVAVNCAALPEQLIETELFGHDRGAFTGAAAAKPGLLESADRGTTFLDEIGELPLAQQGKLLRVLEAGEVMRVGALKPRPIDVRWIAATNRDLAREIESGSFRRDLFFRLAGMTLVIPALRERREDILPLARHFAARAAKALKRKTPVLSPEAVVLLERHAFPGNVRELRNVIERAVALTEDDAIVPEHLHLEPVTFAPGSGTPGGAISVATAGPSTSTKTTTLATNESDERTRIVEALAQCAGNQTRAAERLGISRRTLVNRLGEYAIARPLRERK